MLKDVFNFSSLFGGKKHVIADYTHTHTHTHKATKLKPREKKSLLHALFNFI